MHRIVDPLRSAARTALGSLGVLAVVGVYLAAAGVVATSLRNPIFAMIMAFVAAIGLAIAVPVAVQVGVAKLMLFYDARAPWV